MRIEELILEGFKSYPVRTTITGWDASFNAITGLNGSGKSNILDAIIFVLGITNMSQMRAQNQQDLIYKRGQAGITKASVTIVFDNSDKEKSPVALLDCKQITVTRQIALPNVSKYLLNGHKSQQNIIQTIFQSVQLNINNPNFLIMQGKITKVLNMRPPEILSMIEEAAGTRMFEDRKAKAVGTITRKDKKVAEYNSLMTDEIVPQLNKLRKEKAEYLRLQKVEAELAKIGKVLRGWEWWEGTRRVEAKGKEIEEAESRKETIQEEIEGLKERVQTAENEVTRITKAREKELKKGGRYQRLEEEVREIEKEMERLRTRVELKEKGLREEKKKREASAAELQEFKDGIDTKKGDLAKLEKTYKVVKDQHSAATAALTNNEDLLQSLQTGLAGQSATAAGGGGGYMAQVANARSMHEHAIADEKQAKTRVEMSRKELVDKERRWREVEKDAQDGRAGVDRMGKDVQGLKEKVAKSGWSEHQERESEEALGRARQEARRQRDNRDGVRQRTGGMSFDYQLPNPNFDRSKVKGLVASLITLPPEHADKAQALEMAAGGKLRNVVVADETVGKDLLQHGRLKSRVTIIPLNKIEPRRLSQQAIDAAQRIAPGRAWPAQSLVRCDPAVEKAIAFTFGSTFICADADAAKAVTFSREINARSVTLAGDVYEPGGTLSGGAAPQGSGMLVRMQELNVAEAQLRAAEQDLVDLERTAESSRAKSEGWRRLVKELEMKEHELKLLQDQVEGSNAARVKADVEKLKEQITEHEEAVASAKEKQKATAAEIKKLEKDMSEFKNNKDGKIDELKRTISKQKEALQKQSVVVKTHHKDVQTAQLELESAVGDIEKAEQSLKQADASIKALQEDIDGEAGELAQHDTKFQKMNAMLDEERAKLSHYDDELKELDGAIRGQKQSMADLELDLKKLDHDVETLAREQERAQAMVAELEKIHEWIATEKRNFGKTAPYEFTSSRFNVGELRKQAQKLEDEQKKSKRKVNTKVMGMLEMQEKEESKIKKNLQTVLKDKEKIEQTIAELDRYKREALEKTWKEVDVLFGEVFKDLLPGNFAKLVPPEGQDLMEGLEVKVRLGSVWKQSLTELSGGQRSLIALSLIMSLLQFKPAPMYILDEVDAALDLSHTQHIGQLFRTRFKGSQFIVVSLKEGLFTNANVLFRTRFRDGTSIVERTANRNMVTDARRNGEEDEGRRRRR